MDDPYRRRPERGYVPTWVGHDARKLMFLAARRPLSLELETALELPGILAGRGKDPQRIAKSPEVIVTSHEVSPPDEVLVEVE